MRWKLRSEEPRLVEAAYLSTCNSTVWHRYLRIVSYMEIMKRWQTELLFMWNFYFTYCMSIDIELSWNDDWQQTWHGVARHSWLSFLLSRTLLEDKLLGKLWENIKTCIILVHIIDKRWQQFRQHTLQFQVPQSSARNPPPNQDEQSLWMLTTITWQVAHNHTPRE